jgi:uncharacterized protein (TIGR02266 family)
MSWESESDQELVPRGARAAVALEVAFQSQGELVRAYTQDLGMGGISLWTTEALAPGTEVTLQLRVPGWAFPVRAGGKVVWGREGAMGIAFKEIRPEDYDRLRRLVLEHTWIDEEGQPLVDRAEQPVSADVTSRRTALVQLSNDPFTEVVSDLLGLSGFVAGSDWMTGSKPDVIIAERATAGAIPAIFQAIPVVMANARGPDDLLGSRVGLLNTVAFVPRPASAVRIVEAVKRIFQSV